MVLPGPPHSQTGGKSRATLGGKGLIRSSGSFGGRGIGGKGTAKRHRKILKDNIHGITKPALRRLARRGGIKRISADIYDEARAALRTYLAQVLQDVVTYVEHASRQTVTVTDVIFALKRRGRPIYGFDKETYEPKRR
ncbi:MAG: Histone H4 [Caeruleum heppii]|nr:MAG: Histone H4 [Caeruleum heppii]